MAMTTTTSLPTNRSDTIRSSIPRGKTAYGSLRLTTTSVRVDLTEAGPQVVNANLTLTLSAADAIMNVWGGRLDDTLIGNALENNLDGGPGNNALTGNDSSDNLRRYILRPGQRYTARRERQ